MARHPNKHIREAINHAEESGWTFTKPVAEHTSSVRFGVDSATGQVADFACFRLPEVPKIMLGGFGARSTAVRTEGMIP